MDTNSSGTTNSSNSLRRISRSFKALRNFFTGQPNVADDTYSFKANITIREPTISRSKSFRNFFRRQSCSNSLDGNSYNNVPIIISKSFFEKNYEDKQLTYFPIQCILLSFKEIDQEHIRDTIMKFKPYLQICDKVEPNKVIFKFFMERTQFQFIYDHYHSDRLKVIDMKVVHFISDRELKIIGVKVLTNIFKDNLEEFIQSERPHSRKILTINGIPKIYNHKQIVQYLKLFGKVVSVRLYENGKVKVQYSHQEDILKIKDTIKKNNLRLLLALST
ncbi:uncharacterized protein RJT21DRAFT_111346 [Scheffersomyces amazonensis]|uniref:uncharacterized protein n=1 Tax=Scheffersomyces amazonensis TaxID=1078765 RepID=UPI00315DDB4D